MVYSLNDIYPNHSHSVPTSHETIAENDEREHYTDKTVVNETTNKTFMVNKNMIFGAIGLFVCVSVLISLL